MARRAKEPEAGNGYDPEDVREAMAGLDDCQTKLLSERGRYMQACATIRAGMATVYDEAKEKGIPKKALRTLFNARLKVAAARALIDDLEADEKSDAEVLADALGDDPDAMPLFAAAARPKSTRAKRGTGKGGRRRASGNGEANADA